MKLTAVSFLTFNSNRQGREDGRVNHYKNPEQAFRKPFVLKSMTLNSIGAVCPNYSFLRQNSFDEKMQESVSQAIEKMEEEKNKKPATMNFVIRKGLDAQERKHPNKLDIDLIRSIEIQKANKKPPLPFELSDKTYTLDKYQEAAITDFKDGKSVIVTAPTGTGKTLIAEYGIEDALDKGKKIIYLSPLKALSNEKFLNFSKLFGEYDKNYKPVSSKNIGIVTGDIAINPDADLLVMTTEIYRNMLLRNSKEDIEEALKGFDAVIYDEFHYLSDPGRGKVWEESVMYTPAHMKQMMLSATASNAQSVQNWVQKLNPEIETSLVNVPEDERHVPLKEYVYASGDDGRPTIVETKKNFISIDKIKDKDSLSDRQKIAIKELKEHYGVENEEEVFDIIKSVSQDKGLFSADLLAEKLKEDGFKKEHAEQISIILSDKSKSKYVGINDIMLLDNTRPMGLVKTLRKEDKLPALFFVFSKKKCQDNVREATRKGDSLLAPEESKKVLDKIEEAKENGIYLGREFDENCLDGLLKGYTVHHAGMLPAYKSLVEDLARDGLVKVCFATETLLAGINMPFRTTVFTSLDKFDGTKTAGISPSSFKQGAGRAGRRGKDDIGNVVIMPTNASEYKQYVALSKSTDTSLKSHYNTTYATLLSDNVLNDISGTVKKTFAYHENKDDQENMIKEARGKEELLRKRGFVVEDDGALYLTEKGEIASQIAGMNEILLSEILTDPKYTEDMSPAELAALMLIFADIKDDNPKTTLPMGYEELQKKINPAIMLAKNIQQDQDSFGIKENIKMSTNLVAAILELAQEPQSRTEDIDLWKKTLEGLRHGRIIQHEGDLLRVVNSTIDLLQTVEEIAPDGELQQKANEAIRLLKKPPVTDILQYELDVQ